MKATLITALAFFLTSVVLAQDANLQKIDSIVNSKIAESDPGLMVGIVKDGKIIYEKYRGLANIQHQVKVTSKTRSNIASTAKQFTALMILQMALDKKLSLEDDIRKYLPNLYTNVQEEIKIRQVINHSSGIRDYVELMSLQDRIWWKQMGLDNDDVMELLEKQEELAFKPGSQYTYSNSGYVVLTKIIEKISGESFNDYSDKFFQSLGMNETNFVRRYMGIIPNRAEPYSDWGSGELSQTPTVTKTNGEGFLFTTLKDQLNYEIAIQNAANENNELLIMSQREIPNSEITHYGYGLELGDRLNRKAVHHAGGTYSYHSQMVRYPEENLSIFIMSNNGNISSYLIANEIANVLLPELEKTIEYDPQYADRLSIPADQQVLGQYISEKGSLIRVVKEDGKYFWRRANRNPIELVAKGNNTFAASNDVDAERIVFYKDELILFQPNGEKSSYKRSQEPMASLSDLEGLVGKYISSELNIDFELVLAENNDLKLKFSGDEELMDLQVLNRSELMVYNYILKVKRDRFDRVTDIFVDYDRAKNMRFKKSSHLKFQPKIATDNGSIQVTTIGSQNGDTSDILLTANYPNGNEIWNQRIGGDSWDKASSILDTGDGYLIIGSTSSYGNGNYDIYVIKTDKEGKQLWQNTYGGFYNEYGYSAKATDKGYLIKGTKQFCDDNEDINRECTTNVWFVTIDKNGKELSNDLLEELITK